MSFSPGDRVHLPGLGTGTIREARGGGRYAVEIKGRIVVVEARNLERVTETAKPRRKAASRAVAAGPLDDGGSGGRGAGPSLDLHGMTTDEARAAVEVFINDALLAGYGEVRIIHGRSGGRLKAVVHEYLRAVPAVAGARADPRNSGVTIVTFS